MKHNALTPTSLLHPGGDLSVESLTMRCVPSTSHCAPAPCADGSQRDSGRWVSGCCTVKDTSSSAATLIPTRPRLGTARAQKKKKKMIKSLHKSIGQLLREFFKRRTRGLFWEELCQHTSLVWLLAETGKHAPDCSPSHQSSPMLQLRLGNLAWNS